MRIQLAQVNPVTGDIEGNVEKVRSCLREAGGMGVDLTIFPECMISGFPAGGLLECPEFLRQCEEAVNNLARQIKGIAVIVGVPLKREGKVSSAAVVLEGGMVRAEHVGAPQEGDAWADGERPTVYPVPNPPDSCSFLLLDWLPEARGSSRCRSRRTCGSSSEQTPLLQRRRLRDAFAPS